MGQPSHLPNRRRPSHCLLAILGLGLVASCTVHAASRNLVRNASFEENRGGSPVQWQTIPEDAGDTISGSPLAHDGQLSLLLQNPPMPTQCLQTVEGIQPGRFYKLQAWVKVTSPNELNHDNCPIIRAVQRDAKGNSIRVIDKTGERTIAQARIWCLKADNQWQRLEQRFMGETGVSNVYLMLQSKAGFAGKVWFDDVQIVEVHDDERLAGDWLSQMHTGIATPHVKWAKPLAGGPLKLFCLLANPGKREFVELWQRLDIDAETVVAYSPSRLGLPGHLAQWRGSSQAEKIAELNKKLATSYDAYVIGNVAWEAVPEPARHRILNEVIAGKGIVFVFEQANTTLDLSALRNAAQTPEALQQILAGNVTGVDISTDAEEQTDDMADDLDELLDIESEQTSSGNANLLAALPHERLTMGQIDGQAFVPSPSVSELVSVLPAGNGRAAFLDYPYSDALRYRDLAAYGVYEGSALTPHIPYTAANWTDYEHHMQLLIRAVLDVSKRKLASININPQHFDAGTAHTVKVVIADGAAADGLWYRIQDKGHTYAEGQTTAGGNLTAIDIPAMPAGEYVLDARLLNEAGNVCGFGSFAITITGPATIADLQVAPSALFDNQVTGSLTLNGNGVASVALELTDRHQRLLKRHIINGSGTTWSFSFPWPLGQVADFHQLRAVAKNAAGAPLAVATSNIMGLDQQVEPITYLMWSSSAGGSASYHLLNTFAKAAFDVDPYDPSVPGVLAAYQRQNQSPTTALRQRATLAATTGQRISTSIIPVSYHGRETVREPCLNDPAWRQQFRSAVNTYATSCREGGWRPPFYSLCDELLLAYPEQAEVCHGPHCQESFRDWLKRKYDNNLDKLNTAWRSDLRTWHEVTASTLATARRSHQSGRWIDHRLHMDDVLTGVVAEAKQIVTAVDPKAQVGFEGMFRSYSGCGYDLEKLSSHCGFLLSYEYPYRFEMLASFAPPGSRYGTLSNSLGKMPNGTRYQVWKSLLHGLNSFMWWRISGDNGVLAFDFGPGARPDRYQQFVAQSAAIKEAKAGIAQLLQGAKRIDQPIGILYSQTSIHAGKFYGNAGDTSGCWSAFQALFEDLQLGYRYIKSGDLASGKVTPENTKLLVLANALYLPQDVAQAVLDYAQAGGAVLADTRPAMLDAHGNSGPAGPLDALFGIRRKAIVALAEHEVKIEPKRQAASGGTTSLGQILVDVGIRAADATFAASAGPVPVGLTNRNGTAILFNFPASAYGRDYSTTDFAQSKYVGFTRNHELRALAHSLLAPLALEPNAQIYGPSKPALDHEIYSYQQGQTQIVGVLRKFYGHDNDDAIAATELRLNQPGHVYDVRQRKYLGKASELPLETAKGDAKLLAILPYRPAVSELAAEFDKRNHSVTIRGTLETSGHDNIYHVVRVALTDPEGNARPWYTRTLVIRNPQFETTLAMALNDPQGQWTLSVSDVASDANATREVALK